MPECLTQLGAIDAPLLDGLTGRGLKSTGDDVGTVFLFGDERLFLPSSPDVESHG
jgi:hypothetical protein